MCLYRNRNYVFIGLLLFVLPSIYPNITRGQNSLFLYDNGGREIGIEYKRPLLENGDASAVSSIWFISGRFPIGANIAIISDASIVIAETPVGFETQTTVGNPLIGVEIGFPIRIYMEKQPYAFRLTIMLD